MKHHLFGKALVVGLALAVVSGCGKKDDPITKAETKHKHKPSIAETKAMT